MCCGEKCYSSSSSSSSSSLETCTFFYHPKMLQHNHRNCHASRVFPPDLEMFFPQYFAASGPEAACSHVVEFAQEQVRLNSQANRVFRRFASINLADAESACHNLFQKYGYSCPVKVEDVHLGNGRSLNKFPMVKLSSWAQWLLDSDRIWRLFCGCSSFETMRVVLKEFWKRFRALHPRHQVFQHHRDLSTCIPYFSHQDEGRGYKHQAMWIFSCHGAIGRGTHEFLRRGKDQVGVRDREMGLNYIGDTWATHALICTMLRSVTVKCPSAIETIMQLFSEDSRSLALDGLTSKDGRRQIYMIHINTKGDLPALAKVGNLPRTFSHVPRQATSRKAADGICHLCLAGQEADASGRLAFPYEDMSINPRWMETCNQVMPWTATPAILQGALVDPTQVPEFLATDVWHNCHLGVLKHWLASAFISAIERLTFWPEASVEKRFEFLTVEFRKYCQENHISPHMDEISRATMGFPYGRVFPVGQWSKGSVSTHMMKFLESFCTIWVEGQTEDEVMLAIDFQHGLALFSCSCFQL